MNFVTEVKNNSGGFDVLIEVMHVRPLVARVVAAKRRPGGVSGWARVPSHFPNPDVYSLVELPGPPAVFKMVKKGTGKEIQITRNPDPDEYPVRCDCESAVYHGHSPCKHAVILDFLNYHLEGGVYDADPHPGGGGGPVPGLPAQHQERFKARPPHVPGRRGRPHV